MPKNFWRAIQVQQPCYTRKNGKKECGAKGKASTASVTHGGTAIYSGVHRARLRGNPGKADSMRMNRVKISKLCCLKFARMLSPAELRIHLIRIIPEIAPLKKAISQQV